MVKLSTIIKKVNQYETYLNNNKHDYYFICENKALKEKLPDLEDDKEILLERNDG